MNGWKKSDFYTQSSRPSIIDSNKDYTYKKVMNSEWNVVVYVRKWNDSWVWMLTIHDGHVIQTGYQKTLKGAKKEAVEMYEYLAYSFRPKDKGKK